MYESAWEGSVDCDRTPVDRTQVTRTSIDRTQVSSEHPQDYNHISLSFLQDFLSEVYQA